MNKIALFVACLLCFAGVHAQEAASTPSTPAQEEVSAGNEVSPELINAVVQQIADKVKNGEVSFATPVTEPQNSGNDKPETDMQQAVINIFLLMLAATGLIIAFLAKKDAKAVTKQHESTVDALKTALHKQAEDYEDALRTMEQRLRNLEETTLAHNRDTKQATHSNQATQSKGNKSTAPQTLYLTRPDDKGFFLNASTNFEPGNSIFVLHTANGQNGEFKVIDHAEVHRLALMMPTENLTRACSGNNIQVSGGMHRIVTDKAGQATLENGRWRVVTTANIHYEA